MMDLFVEEEVLTWLYRADVLRGIAEEVDPEVRDLMLRVADDFDRLAQEAAAR